MDTEAELARSQRQTEMILRAAAEGVVGTDTDGRVVLVNPAAAQILGYRATDLGNRELHGLVQHSRADGSPFPFEESPLADTLRSGRKHRVRGQVLWNKAGQPVSVDLTTSPVRDGEQLVGAVMTFTDRRPYDTLAARHAQLMAVLGESLRGPLDELRGELATLAADDAGQLWPEANQLLHHLAAGYSRMTTLVDNVLGYQRLDSGSDRLSKKKVLINTVVTAGVDGAVELIGPGRAQFAVHAPTIEAEVDGDRIATALAHLVADVAGVDATGKTRQGSGYSDSTIVVAAAQRGDVVRIEVRGPYEGGNPVHEPIVRGIVAAHGGVLQTVEVPGAPGGAYVLELPLGSGAGTVTLPEPVEEPPAGPTTDGSGTAGGAAPGKVSGGRRGRRGVDAFLDDEVTGPEAAQAAQAGQGGGALALPSGRRRAGEVGEVSDSGPELAQSPVNPAGLGTGRRRGRAGDGSGEAEGSGVQAGQGGPGRPVPPQGTALPALPPVPAVPPVPVTEHPAGRRRALGPAGPAQPGGPVPATGLGPTPAPARPIAPEGGFALPAGPTPATPAAGPAPAGADTDADAQAGRRGRRVLGSPAEPEAPAAQPDESAENPTGRRRALAGAPAWPVPSARTAPEDEASGQVAVPGARRPQDSPRRPRPRSRSACAPSAPSARAFPWTRAVPARPPGPVRPPGPAAADASRSPPRRAGPSP